MQVALSTLSSGFVSDFSLSLTGATIATVPLLLVVFAFLGRRIISGIMHGTPADLLALSTDGIRRCVCGFGSAVLL